MHTSIVVTSTTPLWYSTRATGVVALVLLTGSVVLGILISVRFATERWPRFVTIGVHRNLSLLVSAFLVVHIVTAVADSYAPVGWLSVVVPFASAYRPIWMGLGTVASDLLVAVTVTSLLRNRIGYRTWRIIHWTAYACWPSAVVHGLGSGSDTKAPAILWITVLCTAAVIGAGLWRLTYGWPQHALIRLGAGAAGAVAVVATAAWTMAGPLKPGWAARAGTPAALVARAAGAATTSQAPATAGTSTVLPALPFTTPVTGAIAQTATDTGDTTVTISGRGQSPVVFAVTISGPAADGGGVRMTGSQVTFGPTGSPARYTGHVTALSGTDVQASVTGPAGAAVSLDLRLTVDGTAVTGTLTATAGAGR
jgi:hypothetical protein